jgi:hypothetical protein
MNAAQYRSPIPGVIALLVWLLALGGWVAFMVANTPEPALSSEPRPRGPLPTPTIVSLGVVQNDPAERFASLQATAAPATPTPTETAEPTATSAPVTPLPAEFPRYAAPATPTATPAEPTPTPPLPPPPGVAATPDTPATLEAASGPCDCAENTYDCDDFFTVYVRDDVAQACFTRCLFLTGHDVHQLDADGDGFACSYRGSAATGASQKGAQVGLSAGGALSQAPIRVPDPLAVSREGGSVCNCTGPDLDCDSFDSVYADGDLAQACFEQCKRETGLDIFDLDRDNDGIVCEWNQR